VNLLQAERPFVPYGPSHWALLTLLVAGAVLLAWLGRRHRDTEAARTGAHVFAVAILAFQLPMQVLMLLPPRWDISESLPFQLCDLGWMTAAYALWTRSWWAYALTYYWGITLTPQAMITPALHAPDFPHIQFIEFWGQHCLVVWAAVYLTWGLGMRPNWRSFTTSVSVTVVWAAAMLTFNSIVGTNYGFLNSKPENPSILDLMGGWPGYLAVEFAVGLAAWALLTWPWTRAPVEPSKAATTD
jgi:hypothetical integral membrane protein (TIGR02206 family)